jgi:hypothetical protein
MPPPSGNIGSKLKQMKQAKLGFGASGTQPSISRQVGSANANLYPSVLCSCFWRVLVSFQSFAHRMPRWRYFARPLGTCIRCAGMVASPFSRGALSPHPEQEAQ